MPPRLNTAATVLQAPERVQGRLDDPKKVTVATYNIHRCIGMDGRQSPHRVAEVLSELNADIVALQEVDFHLPKQASCQLSYLAQTLGYAAVAGPTLRSQRGQFGNALLVRAALLSNRRIDLSVQGCEPRCAIEADLEIEGVRLRVIATHLGLRRHERRLQAACLARAVSRDTSLPTLCLGDINEWLPGSAILRLLEAHLGRSKVRASYPAAWPVFALDRVWVRPAAAMQHIQVHRSRMARLASDHLPVWARVDINALLSI